MAAKIEIYQKICDEAREVRRKVFIDEQGFRNEYDEKDATAAHVVLFAGDEEPAATCRIFWDGERKAYVLGRLAVLKEYRGKNFGFAIMEEAERYVRKCGGNCIILHAQCRVSAFYRKLGYGEFGTADEEEGCPHIWMRKRLDS